MKRITQEIHYTQFDTEDELNEAHRALLEKARIAIQTSYAPYSQYHVGAALELDTGEIVIGSNQENGSYPAGLCAERVAIFAAGAQHPGKRIMRIAITVNAPKFDIQSPVPPCGSCRQVMLESELNQPEDIEVILQGTTGPIWLVPSIKMLLPLHYKEDRLKK